MRFLTAVTFSVAAAACGGGDSTPPPVIIDTPPAVDAPPAACAIVADIGGLQLGSTAAPAGNAPNTHDWFFLPTMGPNMGKKTLLIAARLPPEADGDANTTDPDVMAIEVVSNSGVFPVNQAQTFDISAGAASSTTAYTSAAYLLGDFNSTGGTVQNFYWAGSGTVTLTAVGETTDALTTGMATATAYREVDNAGADVAGGCTTMMGGLAFTLKETVAPAFQGGGEQQFSRAEMQQIADIITAHHIAQATRQ